MTAIKAILFDKDGTLLDYHRTWGPINVAAADIAGHGDAALARRLLVLGGTDPETLVTRADSLLAAANTREIAAAWVAAGSPLDVDELTRRLDALFTASVEAAVPVTDLSALFAGMAARGLRLGIASSDSEGAIRRTAERFGIASHLDFVAGYDSGHGVKPGPGMVTAFCAAVGVAPSETAVVGDNHHDMAMAESAGAGLRIAVLTGTGTRETLGKIATVCLDGVTEIESWLFEAAVS